jgi:ATP-dependent Clp protease ATP-binding subunit ClpC
VVEEDNVAEVIAMMTGIPAKRIAQNEGAKLLNMNDELSGKVIGQEEAIKKAYQSNSANSSGLERS